jgi:hypothetical protein
LSFCHYFLIDINRLIIPLYKKTIYKILIKSCGTITEEAGATLLADGLVSDMELAAEIIPDLIGGDKRKGSN